MSNVDKAWLEMDSATNLMIINGVMLFEDKLDFEDLKAILAERFVAKYERFRQRIVMGSGGRLYWEDDPHFDIRAHVRRYALPEPGDIATLQTVVSAIINEPLDRRKPLWRYMLIENVDGGSAILARLHHCIGDGIALIKVLLDMTGPSASESLQLPHLPAPRRSPPGPLTQLSRLTRTAVKTSIGAAQTIANGALQTLENPSHPLQVLRSAGIISAASAAILAKLVLLPPDRPSVFKGELGAIKRVVWSQPFPLDRVKAIGKGLDATVNDVLVAAVSGGLRRYMLEVGDDPTLGDITAMVPVNLRPENDHNQLGNEFALVYLCLPVSLTDAHDRLLMTKRHMDVLKSSPEPFLVYQILGVIGTLPGDVAKQATTWFAAKASAVLTNVPGPRQQIYFAGKPLKDLMFWVPQSGNISMGISIISYNGNVMLGIMADEQLVTNPQRVIDGFEQELADLERRFLPRLEAAEQSGAGKGAGLLSASAGGETGSNGAGSNGAGANGAGSNGVDGASASAGRSGAGSSTAADSPIDAG
jgi:WS/DGAT/MGAT family acyltransferase